MGEVIKFPGKKPQAKPRGPARAKKPAPPPEVKTAVTYTLDQLLVAAQIHRHMLHDEATAARLILRMLQGFKAKALSVVLQGRDLVSVTQVLNMDDEQVQDQYRRYIAKSFGT